MSWWNWALLGIVLLGLETVNGGFYLFFVALSALLISAFVWAELATGGLQWVFFGGFSLALLLLLRAPLLSLTRGKRSLETDSLVGERAVATTAIAVGERGRVELRGSTWDALNLGPSPLQIGDQCFVNERVGLLLKVKTEN